LAGTANPQAGGLRPPQRHGEQEARRGVTADPRPRQMPISPGLILASQSRRMEKAAAGWAQRIGIRTIVRLQLRGSRGDVVTVASSTGNAPA
jgi:alkanesulfonate monooxygenase SsuD/methylene tetrahydromethanopterin reductase-like flavin-dependent oxidoreductase (luciferase family)